MPFNAVLRWFHPMVGCDFHIPHPPPLGNPLPAPGPYAVFQIMGNPVSLTKLHTTTIFANQLQNAMCRGSDIGSLIPHIGTPSIIIAIEIAFSGSKCHFGPLSTVVRDQYGAQQNPAAAVLGTTNVNLNCGFPAPTPFGFVFTFNTVVVEMTMGDIWAGWYSMCCDIIFQTIINLLSYFALSRLAGAIARRVAPRAAAIAASRGASRGSNAARAAWKAAKRRGYRGRLAPFARQAQDRARRFLEHIGLGGESIMGFGVGSPLGTAADAPAIGGPSGYGLTRSLANSMGMPTDTEVQQWVDGSSSDTSGSGSQTPTSDYLNDASVEDVND